MDIQCFSTYPRDFMILKIDFLRSTLCIFDISHKTGSLNDCTPHTTKIRCSSLSLPSHDACMNYFSSLSFALVPWFKSEGPPKPREKIWWWNFAVAFELKISLKLNFVVFVSDLITKFLRSLSQIVGMRLGMSHKFHLKSSNFHSRASVSFMFQTIFYCYCLCLQLSIEIFSPESSLHRDTNWLSVFKA
jgi:hypothetical protein